MRYRVEILETVQTLEIVYIDSDSEENAIKTALRKNTRKQVLSYDTEVRNIHRV